MKKIAAIIVAAVLLGTMVVAPAFAGEPGWSVAGKILTGVIGLHILGNALHPHYAHPAPVYAPPPGAYYPPEQFWVPGHYESRLERRWIPGHWEYERIERYRYEDDDDFDGGARRYWVPGHYSNVEVRLWIPGHWEG
ncbi:MAG: hypothetical protein HY896_01920 [Deltaproteobacteria bacterium]|nr:hypothetical protein [Deltaproteobacteria bacterium]